MKFVNDLLRGLSFILFCVSIYAGNTNAIIVFGILILWSELECIKLMIRRRKRRKAGVKNE